MHNFRWLFTLILLVLFFLVGCEETETAVPAPQATKSTPFSVRWLDMSISEAQGETYDTALNLAQSVGMQTTSLSLYWDEIETAPGVYQPDPNWLAIANAYYPAQEIKISLTISVIDTNNLRLPADLVDKSFDDPVVVARFNDLLNYIASQLPDLTPYVLAIGNEIDVYLWQDAAQWAAYEAFFVETAAHARMLWPSTPIGSKTTFSGLINGPLAVIQSLNQHADVVLITYYPLNAEFKVRPPTAVHDDFQTLSDTFANQTIYLLETGYPSGTKNDSSEAKQADFIRELFLAWDAHAEQIPVINYTWLTDVPETAVTEMTRYYGLADAGFVSYLATLGLRTSDGRPKPAFDQLATEAAARGWQP
jgi:hypothetical protein